MMAGKYELLITREYDAPREAVFKEWTDPKLMAHWFGPRGFTVPRCEVDARPGGKMRIDMQGPDGKVYPSTGVIHEVIEPSRLVFSTTLLDDNGRGLIEDYNTVTFADFNGKTRLTLHARVVNALPEAAMSLDGMEQGWNETLDRLGGEFAKAA